MTHHAKKQTGFTLVELLMALAFVAFVLIFITTTIIQVMRTYNKGLAIKEINQTARSTMEDMTRIVRESSPSAINTTAHTSDPTTSKGRLCFGGVSYVWNFRDLTLADNRYTDNSRITFVRVDDPGGALCIQVAGAYPKVLKSKATELLSSNAWVQQLYVTRSVNNNFYDLFMQLSTVDDTTNPSINYNFADPNPALRVECKGGNQGQFCAVANFQTSASARGGIN